MSKPARTSKKKLPTANLEDIAEAIRRSFAAKDAAREKALHACREVIRYSANAIRAIHRKELPGAAALLVKAGALLAEVREALAGQEELYYTGAVHDAQKEFAEGCITLAMVSGKPVPEPAALSVSMAAYLNGMGEAVGEMRRYVLDMMRTGAVEPCEPFLTMMDDIYGVLVTMDFPDAITAGLRRTTDMVRGVLERTRGDLTLALEHKMLEDKIEALRKEQERGANSGSPRRAKRSRASE